MYLIIFQEICNKMFSPADEPERLEHLCKFSYYSSAFWVVCVEREGLHRDNLASVQRGSVFELSPATSAGQC